MNCRMLLCCLVLLFLSPCLANAAPGDLDPAFGVGGKVTTAIGSGNDGGWSAARQSDGKILVVGSSSVGSNDDFAVARHNTDGSLDASFGSGGKVVVHVSEGEDFGRAIAVQPDGKILLAGNGNGDFALVRLNANGTLDTTFGAAASGIVLLDFAAGADQAYGVALQGDGRIVLAGQSWNGTDSDVALARFLADGTLDTSFGTGGKVTAAIGSANDAAYSLVIQSDGKLVVAGDSTEPGRGYFAVARFNADGTLDTGFGSSGTVTTAVGTSLDQGRRLALQPDGRIVVAGLSYNGSNYDFAVVRYNADGSLDSGFGSGGLVTTAIGTDADSGNSIVVQENGKIVVAGNSLIGANSVFALVRYTSDGNLDTTFGVGGKVTTTFGSGSASGIYLLLQPNGRLVVAGDSFNGLDSDFALARYEGDPVVITIPEAVDNTVLAWTTGGSAPWFGQDLVFSFGNDAAQSGAIGDFQISWVETSVTGPGQLSFLWKVSSEEGYDLFKFEIDGAKQPGSISGERNWAQRTVVIPAGSHTLRWIYSKDESYAVGQDAAWLDKVVFSPLHTLSIASTEPASGIVISMSPSDNNSQGMGGTPFQGIYLEGTSVILTAPATAANHVFRTWSGCDSVSGNSCTVAMTSDRSVTANYSPALLSIASTGTSVTVQVSPPDTNQQSNGTTPFSRAYNLGSSVNLTAPAISANWTFNGWSGCSTVNGTVCTVSMTADRTVTAAYLSPFSLNVATAGSGSVTSSLAGISCGANCTAEYPRGTVVTLSATPDPGSILLAWSGCDSSRANSCTVVMSANKVVTATFHTGPTVTSVSPTPGAAGVSPSTPVTVTFSADMDPATISTGTVTLSQFVGVSKAAAGYEHTIVLRSDGSMDAWGRNTDGQTTVPAGLSSVNAIAGGNNHTIALKGDGTVAAWGNNAAGQVTVPTGLAGVTAIAGGGSHSVALKNNGTVVAWGDNFYGQTTVPTGLTGVIAIAAGDSHTLALKNDGTVVAWGDNFYGQATVPAGLTGVTAIAAGGYHSLALKNDGTVVAWGNNFNGQASVPTGLNGVTAIAAGWIHTLALKSDGTVVAWGDSTNGQATVPTGLSGVTAISAGGFHTIARKNDTTLVIWGKNNVSQATIPADISGVTAVSAGGSHTMALQSDGSVAVLGDNSYGQATIPAGLNGVFAISAGGYHSVALKGDGTVVAWGGNWAGQSTVPSGFSNGIAIAAGWSHTVALKWDGTVVAWGDNSAGQRNIPVGLSGVIAIAAGSYHSVALKGDGTVVVWGDNIYGQSTVPVGLSNVIAIAAGAYHTVALKGDGTVVAWGYNTYGQATVPNGLSGVIAISAGLYHTVALKGDGTVVAWGNNGSAQIDVPSGLNGVVAVAGGGYHSLALKRDGTFVAWGANWFGQATVPASPYYIQVGSTVNYEGTTRTATFTPSQSLPAGTLQATVHTGARDVVGAPLAADVVWSFTTSALLRISIPGQPDSYYNTLQDAVTNALPGADLTLATLQMNFTEDLLIDRCTKVIFTGSYDATFTTLLGPTVIVGSVVISCGSVEVTGGGLQIQ